jgi:hypothetical protein
MNNFELKLPKQLKFVLLAVIGILVVFLLLQQTTKWSRLNYMAGIPNQACRGVSEALKLGFTLDEPNIEATSSVFTGRSRYKQVAQYKCNTGTFVTGSEKHPDGSKSKRGYSLGADVIYFRDNAAAYSYAEDIVNPTRYWGVDTEGQKNNIPQTSLFTFLETAVEEPYFDSYTVRDNRVFSLKMSCDVTKAELSDDTLSSCHQNAEAALKAFAENSTLLHF